MTAEVVEMPYFLSGCQESLINGLAEWKLAEEEVLRELVGARTGDVER